MAEQLTHKVAFTGAGGVGKTTLLERMGDVSPARSIGLVGEAARGYFASNPGIPENQRYSFYHQARIQRMAMGAELAIHESGHDQVFTDRSVFDAAVCVASTGSRKDAEKLLTRAEMWIPGESEISYSQIYVLDPDDVPFENDPVRTESAVTRQRQHQTFLEFFSSHGIGYELLSGTLEERTQVVLGSLPKSPKTLSDL